MTDEQYVRTVFQERLGIYSMERGHFETSRVSDNETCLNVLASSAFLKGKTKEAREQYQIVMEDVVASRRSVVNIIPGEAYPGNFSGFVVLFATAETAGRRWPNYFKEVWQSMRFLSLIPRRFYYTTFANGVITYSLFFPAGVEKQVERLKRSLLYSTLLKATPNNSALVYDNVMQSRISHECGLYLLAAVKFVYDFFPKEQYAPEYISVHKVLEHDPASQRKLETLYTDLSRLFFEDFSKIALGEVEPRFNTEISQVIDRTCADPQDRQILKMFLTFNHSILLTNFFKDPTPGIYLICGRDFMGFHTRFRDVSRGGIRLVLSRDKNTYERNFATLFEDTPDNQTPTGTGGSKGVILPDRSWPNSNGGNVVAGASIQGPLGMRSCFTRYLDALLDCMMPEQSGIFAGHLKGQQEILFFGPDENTAGFMDLGAEHAKDSQHNFHLTDYATADLFVPCGGRPNAVTTDNVKRLFTSDGSKPHRCRNSLEEGLKAAAAKQVALVQRWYNAEMALGGPQMVSSARGEGLDVLAAAADSAVAMWLRAVPQGKGLLVLQDGLDYMTRDGPRRLLARLLCRHKGLHLLVTLSRKGSQAQGLDEKPLSPHVTELGRVVPLPSLSHHEAAQVFVSLLYRRGQDRLLNGLTRDKAVELLQDEKLLRNCKGQLGEVLSAARAVDIQQSMEQAVEALEKSLDVEIAAREQRQVNIEQEWMREMDRLEKRHESVAAVCDKCPYKANSAGASPCAVGVCGVFAALLRKIKAQMKLEPPARPSKPEETIHLAHRDTSKVRVRAFKMFT
eukprot:g2301.t1